MIQSAVTVSLVPEARGGPFVFWDDLEGACRKAAELGFDGIELFAPNPEAINEAMLRPLLRELNLKVAAFGTGAGWVRHKLNLCLPDAAERGRAREFIRSIIDLGGRFGAPAIIGSMQGRWGDVPQESAHGYLAEALEDLGEHANKYGVPLIFEPLNRYETNLCNSIGEGVAILEKLSTKNVKLLADLFHLNIEEVDIATSLKAGGGYVGHVHFVDSNRRAAGMGHIDFAPIAAALREMKYDGYLSAEAVAYPDSFAAARGTIEAYRKFFGKGR